MANGAGGQGGVPTGTGGFKGGNTGIVPPQMQSQQAHMPQRMVRNPAGGMMQAGQYSGMSGPQSGYQTPQQLLTQVQGGADLNAQMGPGGSLLRQLMNAGPQALAGADQATLARIKQAAQGAYQGQIDQNNAQAAYWGDPANAAPNAQGVVPDAGLFGRSNVRLQNQLNRWK